MSKFEKWGGKTVYVVLEYSCDSEGCVKESVECIYDNREAAERRVAYDNEHWRECKIEELKMYSVFDDCCTQGAWD